MNILSYEVVNGMVRVVTDHSGRNEFVYEEDRFSSKDALVAEIERSVLFESRLKSSRSEKSSLLSSSLKSSGAVEVVRGVN